MRIADAVMLSAVLSTLACGGNESGSTGPTGAPSVDKAETFTVPPEYIDAIGSSTPQGGISASDLTGKWLCSAGGTRESLQHSDGTYDWYTTAGERGDVEFLVFYPDSTYHLSYFASVTMYGQTSTGYASEVGRFELNADRSLTLTPTDALQRFCVTPPCGSASKVDPLPPPRTYATQAFLYADLIGARTNPGFSILGPCAPYMIEVHGYACSEGDRTMAFQRVQ